jgi:hypothetical protein
VSRGFRCALDIDLDDRQVGDQENDEGSEREGDRAGDLKLNSLN